MAGTARPITLVGTPVLHARCADVETFDAALAELTEDMFASMYEANGVGLAANQIGVALRVFVYDCPDGDDVARKGVIVNPELELPGPAGRHLDDSEEGCLSVPGPHASVARPDHAVCRGFDVEGRPVAVHGTGLLARCLQHETDHLDGKLYIDRISAKARKRVLKEMAELQNSSEV
ncbi:peptide deformylase [Actinomadura parmotrematis]|uniref:Peptide deformylase n=1 Tax=Actinomadura parmotrematis TaxID=2864039 RepID=A0ABS7FU90_9ACTN|nr:peptide deformylase [Actinomadura parmotrematis]MBW8483098.1 peptide deformylase [Actinomadura parmotrematis]